MNPKILAAVVIPILAISAALLTGGEPMGTIPRTAEVLTDASPYIKDGYPVFEIQVPVGMTEIQIRASENNFAEGFTLIQTVAGADTVLTTYVKDTNEAHGYRSLDPNWTIYGASDTWSFTASGVDLTTWTGTTPSPIGLVDGDFFTKDGLPVGATVKTESHRFIYHTCTTGQPADSVWGQSTGDPSPTWIISKQTPGPVGNTDVFTLKKLVFGTFDNMTDQLGNVLATWSPGRTVLFQPSRETVAAADWMQQGNSKLTWICHFQQGTARDAQPDNLTQLWQVIHPKEWRKEPLTLATP